MLVEIQSDVFKGKYIQNGKIKFHKGLNTIVASESTNNSTGKSSFLLAIDFAFGGNTYVTGGGKIIENVGHHVVNFTFEFKEEKFYYSRSTEDLNNVSVCDKSYSAIDKISLKEFQKRLAENCGFEDESLTFRGAVSPYFRISHKSSKNLEEFLKGNSMENARDCVVNFEKLFDRYKEIAAEKSNADDAAKAKETFYEAVKRNFIPSSIKTDSDFTAVYENINRLKEELSELSRTNDKEILAFDSNNAEKLQALEKKYKSISIKKSRLENKIAVAEHSIEGLASPTREELSVLQSFFPELNVKKVYAVEKFHESLTEVLKLQINDEIQYLTMNLNQVNLDFEAIKSEYEKALPDGTVSKAAFDVYGKKYLELQRLYDCIENYKKGKLIALKDSAAKKELNKKEINVLGEIASQVNLNMAALNGHIQNGKWKNPVLKFFEPKTGNAKGVSRYSIISGTDKGDGTESANIIMFDLSILKQTKLPAIAHDLFVRNELDAERKEDCIKLYATEKEKQIFTAFRSIYNYSPEVQSVIEDNRVLKLSTDGGELYGTSKWVKK